MNRKRKRQKWEEKNLITPEEKKRGLKINRKESKRYRGIDYELISLESDSGMKWIALESNLIPVDSLLFDISKWFTENDDLHDILWSDSLLWDKFPIEYQWNKMDKKAKQEIDQLYELTENLDKILEEKVKFMTTLKDKMKVSIEKIKGSE